MGHNTVSDVVFEDNVGEDGLSSQSTYKVNMILQKYALYFDGSEQDHILK